MQVYSCHLRPLNIPLTRLSAGPALPPPPQNLSVQSKRPEISMGRAAAQPQDGRSQPVPFIDTLPKSKQRQIFGVGLRSFIQIEPFILTYPASQWDSRGHRPLADATESFTKRSGY